MTQYREVKRFVRGLAALALLAGIAMLAACDVQGILTPPQPPTWDTTWDIALPAVNIAPSTYLPSGISEAPDAFEFALATQSTTITLGDYCAACLDSAHVRMLKPAVTAGFRIHLPLGADTAVLASGNVVSAGLIHTLPFDPIRGRVDNGSLTITIGSAGRDLAELRMDGATDSLPPSFMLSQGLTLPGGSILAGSVDASVSLVSPAGDSVTFTGAETITASLAASKVRLASVTVGIRDTSLTWSDSVALPALSASIGQRIDTATVILAIHNPWNVGVNLTVTIGADSTALWRTLSVPPGASEQSVSLTGSEATPLMGHKQPVVVVAAVHPSNSVGGTGTVTLRPGEQLTITPHLRIVASSAAH